MLDPTFMRSIYLQGQAGKSYQLVDADDMIIVRSNRAVDIFNIKYQNKANRYLIKQHLKEIAHFPESNVRIYQIQKADKDIVVLRDELRSILKNEKKEIKFAGRVLRYENGKSYKIYTENIFVKFRDHLSSNQCRDFIKSWDDINKIKNQLHFCNNGFFIESRDNIGQDVFDLSKEILDQQDIIEFAHPELVVKRKSLNKDIRTYYKKVQEGNNWVHEKINLTEAWKTTKGEGIKIAIIDDGIEKYHPAFKNRIIGQKDFSSQSEDASHKFPLEMHGTACASIAVANDKNIQGIAPEASLLPIRSKGFGSVRESEAFYWAVHQGADIISCSWGPEDGYIFDTQDDELEQPIPDHTRLAIDYAAKHGRNGKGAIILFAAGNGREPVKHDGYASHPKVLAIGSSNKTNKPTVYTDFGCPLFCVFPSGDYAIRRNQKLEKKYGVKTADRLGKEGANVGDYYDLFDGTSASCPGVAGVVALMLSINPKLKLTEIKEILKQSCLPLGRKSMQYNKGGFPYSEEYGYGLIQADLATKNTKIYSQKIKNKFMEQKIFAVHIGINVVDNNYYQGQISNLEGCVNDMNTMSNMVSNKYGDLLTESPKLFYSNDGFEDEEILPTKGNILGHLKELKDKMEYGDFLIISYAGHGAPHPDINGDEDDNTDESWVCYDGFLIDDELNEAFAKFAEGVNILVISDSCHSGTTTRTSNFSRYSNRESRNIRYTPISTVKKILELNGELTQRKRSMADPSITIDASVLLLGACQDHEFAGEDNGEGLFTRSLKTVYQNNYNLSYKELMDQIKAYMPHDQNPNIYQEDLKDPRFLDYNFMDFSPRKIKPLTTWVNEPEITEEEEILSHAIIEINYKKDETNRELRLKKSATSLFEHAHSRYLQTSLRTKDLNGKNPWDKAHTLLDHIYINDLDKIERINLKAINSFYDDQNYRKLKLRKTDYNDKSYLPSYPDPSAKKYNIENKMIWHLEDNYSQLRSAFYELYHEQIIREDLPDKNEVAKIAHFDTGIYPDHPLLPERFDKDKSDNNITDTVRILPEQQGHGMGTISILAGRRMSGLKHGNDEYFGAHPFANIISYRLSDSVAVLNSKQFVRAINKAIEEKVDVITMSMAGLPDADMADAVNRAYEQGIVIVSAAGNNFVKGLGKLLPKTMLYPARFDRVISALGVTLDNTPYLYDEQEVKRAANGEFMQMCYGPKYAMTSAMAAYTPNIPWFGNNCTNLTENSYVNTGGGTSSATPQIAAAAALYIDKYRNELDELSTDEPWIKAEIVRQALFQSAKLPKKHQKQLGQGILKAKKLLKPKYHPNNIANGITKAKEAKWNGGFFNKLLKSYRSQTSKQQLKNLLLQQELMYLIHRDESLSSFQEINFESNDKKIEISDKDKKDLLIGIHNSSYSSQFLKSNLSFKGIDLTTELLANNRAVYFLQSDDSIKLRGQNVEFISVKEKMETVNIEWTSESVQLIHIEADLKIGNRSRGTGINIDHDNDSNNEHIINYVQEEVDGEMIAQWNFDHSKSLANRSNAKQESTIFMNIDNDSLSSENRSLKNFGGKIKKGWTIIKSVIKKEHPEVLVGKIIEQKNKLRVFDLKDEQWIGYTEDLSLEEKDREQVKLEKALMKIKSQKHTLFLFHGLFSCCKAGFGLYLKKNSPTINRVFDRYVVGFDSADVVQGLEGNAEAFLELLSKYAPARKKKIDCTVLARSRGCAVARFIFEDKLQKAADFKLDLKLKKMILLAPPNQGSPIAEDKKYTLLLNVLSTFSKKLTSPLIGSALCIAKYYSKEIVALPGIDDLEPKSTALKKINQGTNKLKNYYVVMSNFDSRNILRIILNKSSDLYIFRNKPNDGVLPVLGATELNKKTILKEGDLNLLLLSKKMKMHHFDYMQPYDKKFYTDDNEDGKNKVKDEVEKWLFE